MNHRRVLAICVHNLLGIFDYSIRLNLVDRITIIHGPNGCGKSTLFALLSSILARDFSAVRAIPFGWISLDFSDGTQVTVYANYVTLVDMKKDGEWVERYQHAEVDPCEGGSLYFEVRDPGEDTPRIYELSPSKFRNILDPFEAERDRSQLPGDGNAPDPYEYERTRNPDAENDCTWIVSLYNQTLREYQKLCTARSVQFDGYVLPPLVAELLEGPRVVHIGADRLSPRVTSWKGVTPGAPRILQVFERLNEVREDHQAVIDEEEKEFAASFNEQVKRRMLAGEATVQPLGELVSQLSELVEWFGLSEYWKVIGDPTIDEGLENYLSEIRTNEKLRVYFDRPDLENRVALSLLVEHLAKLEKMLSPYSAKYDLVEVLLKRLMWKDLLFGTLHINVSRSDGDPFQREISPLGLSSGEQHLIALACILLFETEPGSLVLIDEPELSLHVSWQRQFLQILEEIIALNPMDVVIATHSPQIVYDRRDLMVSLGPVE